VQHAKPVVHFDIKHVRLFGGVLRVIHVNIRKTK